MKKVSLKLGRYQNKFVSLHHNLLVFINHLNEKKIMAYVIGDDCIACGTCIDECPAGAISEGDKYSINHDACTECGTCADVCPSEAISLP